jgi:peptidyl-prolyl cis-trans isomerase D
VTERREPAVRPFEEVRTELVSGLTNDRARQTAGAEMNRISAQLKASKPANVNAFSALANANVTSNDGGWVGRGEQFQGIGAHQVLSDWVFAAKPGDVSDPIGTPRGVAIAYVAATRPAGVNALNDIRERVTEDARLDKGRTAARARLQQLMAGATTIDEVAQKAGTGALDTSVSHGNRVVGFTGDASALIDAALASNVGALKGPVLVNDGAVAFQVSEQKKVTPQELQQNKTQMMDTLRGQQARNLRQTLIQRLRKNAEIEVNDEITRPTTAPAGV